MSEGSPGNATPRRPPAPRSSRPKSGCDRGAARLALLFLAALASSPAAPAQTAQEGKIIRKIEIRGLQRMSESELLSRLSRKVRIGEVYDPRAVIQETGRLYTLGNFRRVENPIVTDYEDGVAITFVVEEKPIVRSVRFVGREELSRSKLQNAEPALLTREGELYNPYWVQQDQETIREKYLEEGYLFAQVETRVEEDESGARVAFVINEGTRVRIREVDFVGNKAIPDGDLVRRMSTREKDFWFFGLWHPGFYSEEALQRDLLTLKMYYRSHGYFDVRVEVEKMEFDETKRKLHITIRVVEGPVYMFRGYRFSGNAVFSDQTLRKLASAPVGKPFRAELVEKDRAAIKNYYGDQAYIFAKVDWRPVYALERPEAWVHFDIEEDNEIFIEHIKVQGNAKTQDRVVRRELEFYPGERIDHSKLVKSRSNLARLRLFRDITYSFEGTGSRRDVVVNVEEEASGQLIVGFGVTSGFGVIGNLSITKRNFDITDWPDSIYEIPDRFTGAGQTLHLVAQPGTRRSLYRLRFIEPYLFNTRNRLELSASSLDLIREDWDEERATFAPSVAHSFDFDRDFEVGFGARLENVEVDDVEIDAPADVKSSRGHSAVIALNTRASYNKVLLEPLEGPFDGHSEAIFYEFAGGFLGGDVDFHKVEVHNDVYFPIYVHEELNLHHVISLSNRFGFIEPQDSNDFIPVFERYFLGGPHTVRGFRFRGLGPHEGGTPFGGLAQIHGNLEYTFPIFQKLLRGVAFLDYGNLQGSLSALDLDEMRIAAGGGIRIMFPFLGGRPLPISLYFGVPIRKEDQDRERLFLFTIGTPF